MASKKLDISTKSLFDSIQAQIVRIKGGSERKARCKGEVELLTLCNGGHLTQREAIYAHCFICMGYYVDGKEDCKDKTCPLYYYMPYREGFKEDIKRTSKPKGE